MWQLILLQVLECSIQQKSGAKEHGFTREQADELVLAAMSSMQKHCQ